MGLITDAPEERLSAWGFVAAVLACFSADVLPKSQLRLIGFRRVLELADCCVPIEILAETGFACVEESRLSERTEERELIGFILLTIWFFSVP